LLPAFTRSARVPRAPPASWTRRTRYVCPKLRPSLPAFYGRASQGSAVYADRSDGTEMPANSRFNSARGTPRTSRMFFDVAEPDIGTPRRGMEAEALNGRDWTPLLERASRTSPLRRNGCDRASPSAGVNEISDYALRHLTRQGFRYALSLNRGVR